MVKTFLTTVLALLVSVTVFSQGNSGLGFNYQAVVRGVDGFVLPKQSVELRFSLMPGQQATQASWVETHNVMTDAVGTIGVTVGKGTKTGGVAATFADVNFAAVHYWLKVEIKESGSYRELSYTQLTSVPYAEVATQTKDIGIPPGTIVAFAGDASKVPAGWLLCDGSWVSRSQYAALFAVIGTAWGYADNITGRFSLPDMRGLFLRGVDNSPNNGTSGRDTDANSRTIVYYGGNSGNNVGSYQGDAIRNITGSVNLAMNSAYDMTDGVLRAYSNGGGAGATGGNQGVITVNIDASRLVPTGSDNRPQNVYVNYIIKY